MFFFGTTTEVKHRVKSADYKHDLTLLKLSLITWLKSIAQYWSGFSTFPLEGSHCIVHTEERLGFFYLVNSPSLIYIGMDSRMPILCFHYNTMLLSFVTQSTDFFLYPLEIYDFGY